MTRAPQPDRRGCCRDERGLATLEWLLITVAVAGLTALAVALVQSRVEDTAAQISESEARLAAAVHTAWTVENDARDASTADFELWDDWERRFSQDCSLIAVVYADIEIEVLHNTFNRATGGTAFDAAAAGYAAAGDGQPATATKAQVQCEVR